MSRQTNRQAEQERELRELIARRGLRVEGGKSGDKFVRVYGRGVDIRARRLSQIQPEELMPTRGGYSDE